MAKNNLTKIFSHGKRELATADADFSKLLGTSPSFASIEAFIRDRYFTIAYLYAFKTLKSRYGGDQLMDSISELVTSVMEPIIGEIRTGSFSFKGRSRFSSYLYGALKRASYVRISIPLPVQREGTLAMEVYELVYQRMEEHEILRLKSNGKEEVESQIRRYILQAKEYLGKKAPIEYEREKPTTSYERMLEEPEHYQEPGTANDAYGDFLADHEKRELTKAMESLDPAQRELVTKYFLEGESLKETGRRLGMHNPQYEKNKALDKLRGRLKDLQE